MQSLIEIELVNTDGEITTTSLEIAKVFERDHADVLKSIKSMSCSQDFYDGNFTAISYTDSLNRSKPSYVITRNGFDFLAMGFTGEKAGAYKEAYITEFSRMEKELRAALPAPVPTLPSLVAEFKAGVELAEIFGFKDNQALLSANKAVEKLTGTNVMLLIGATYLRAPVQEQTYIPTEIGKMLKDPLGPKTVNRILENMGMQQSYRNHNNDLKWRLLEKGEPFGEYVDVDKVSGGAPVKHVHWYATVVPLLQEHIEFEEE